MISNLLRTVATKLEEAAFIIEKTPEIIDKLHEEKHKANEPSNWSPPSAEAVACAEPAIDKVEPSPVSDKVQRRREYYQKWRAQHQDQMLVYKERAKKKRAAYVAVRSLKGDELTRFQNKIKEGSQSTDQIIGDFFHTDDAEIITTIKENLCAHSSHYGLAVVNGELCY